MFGMMKLKKVRFTNNGFRKLKNVEIEIGGRIIDKQYGQCTV